VDSDQTGSGAPRLAGHRPRHGCAPGHHAAAHRRHALRRLRASGRSRRSSRSSIISCRASRWRPIFSAARRSPAPLRRHATGGQVPLAAVTRVIETTGPLRGGHQGQFPVADDLLNVAPGVALGESGAGGRGRPPAGGLPSSIRGAFQGTAQAFQASLTNEPLADPGGAGDRLHRARRALRSYIHPITILSTLPSAGWERSSRYSSAHRS